MSLRFVGFANGKPTDAGVEPDVENVSFLAEAFAAAVRAGGVFGQHGVARGKVPGFSALAVEEVDDGTIQCGIEDGLIASVAEEDGDGHAPDALAADAPVGAGGDHVSDALFAPARIPDDLVNLFNGELAVGGL
jgi:hypothetical protein